VRIQYNTKIQRVANYTVWQNTQSFVIKSLSTMFFKDTVL